MYQKPNIPPPDHHPILELLGFVAPMIVYVYDLRERRNLFINRSLVRELGYDGETAERLDDDPLSSLMHPDDLARVPFDLQHLLAAQDRIVTESAARLRHANGSWRWYRSRCTVYARGADGLASSVCGVLEDITDRHLLEEQLRQAEKLEVVGQMAGAVAHDFNNVLTAILGYAQLLVESLPPGDNRKDAAEIQAAAERATALTRRLLGHARRVNNPTTPVSIPDVMLQLVPILKRLVPESIHVLKLRIPRRDLWVQIDRNDVEQAIINLVINARDAMPTGGTIILGLDAVTGDGVQVPEGTPLVRLLVEDTGTGIEPEIQHQIFEPFFTTKAPGRGTGLGLTSVKRVVQEANGWMTVDSKPGEGTRFSLFFPAVDHGTPLPQSRIAEQRPRGSERVLVVEDDDINRKYLENLLRRDGYGVTSFSKASSALEWLWDNEVDLMMVDVMLAETDGRKLAEMARQSWAGMKILLMSAHPVPAQGQRLLQKPFTPDLLATTLREILEAE